MFLSCTLYEGERGRLFERVGEDVGGWSGGDKMRVVLGFSDKKGREIVEQMKVFLVKVWDRRRRFLGT